ncbi:MAG: phage tail sheath family protein [Geodermatophilaceae bacterium]|nr:phage tail sheath family protein [Geodermatophilaceae bacterium]
MPAALTYPGVYIREVPSGSRSIAGASTSIAAFVGGFARGPVDTAVRMFSFADFETNFGGMDGANPASFAVSQFFINGGGTAYAVRVASGAAAASVSMGGETGATAVLRATAGQVIADRAVDNPGAWGNALRLEVDYRTVDPANQFNLFVSQIRLQDGIAEPVRTEVFRNLVMTAGATNNALAVVNAGSAMIRLDQGVGFGNARPAGTGFLSGDVSGVAMGTLVGAATLNVNFGTGVRAVPVNITVGPANLAAVAALLQDAIRTAFPADRLFAQATVNLEGARLRVAPGRNSPDYAPGTIVSIANSAGTLATTLRLTNALALRNVEQYFAEATLPLGRIIAVTSGTDSGAMNTATLTGNRAARTGIYALDNVDAFNMLAIPEAAEPALQTAVMAPALAYVIERRAMLFIDPPPGTDTLEEAEAWLDGIAAAGMRSPNSVAYYPRLRVSDPTNDGRLRDIAPSGTMAGVWARTDGESGVWKAPAGTTASLRGVPELTHVLSDPQNGVLNPAGLNALRSFDIPGNIAWGARTLMGADLLASDWKYVPVRRTALFIESSLFDGLQWAVFQPNADPLWLEIRGAVNAFMQGLFRQGAFKGTSPREAYIVRCGPDTTTQADINAGIVNVFVGFAPLQPAEFVVVSLQLQLQQAA